MTTPTMRRRRFLGAVAGATVGAGAFATPGTAQGPDLSEWFANTSNADGIVDRTGQSEVTVKVGVQGNGGDGFAFGPAAVRIDPGTTVVWEWTGKGGQHNVVATDGTFESSMSGDQGTTFEHAFESSGVWTYYCAPHKAMGMKGAIVVGDVDVSLGGSGSPSATPTPADDGTPAGDARSFDGWFAETSNYAGLVDKTGQDEVTVAVGAEGNGGPFAFDPPAIHIDPGTTVVWEWVSDGVAHDVVDAQERFASEASSERGHRYGVQFDGSGLSKYECTAHSAKGMRGVVLVGEGREQRLTSTGIAALCGAGALAGVGLFKGLQSHLERTTTPADEDR